MTSATWPRLAIVTESGLSPAACTDAVSAALTSLSPGRALVILRDTSRVCGADHLRALAPCCAASDAPLFVHARLGSFEANRHIPDGPNALEQMREFRASHPGRHLSVSTHNPTSAIAASEVADIVFLGPIWPTDGKPKGLGVDAISMAAAGFRQPGHLYAIGGITTPERATAALDHGAHGIAGIRRFNGRSIDVLDAAISALDAERT